LQEAGLFYFVPQVGNLTQALEIVGREDESLYYVLHGSALVHHVQKFKSIISNIANLTFVVAPLGILVLV
jgi:hypothetical protein